MSSTYKAFISSKQISLIIMAKSLETCKMGLEFETFCITQTSATQGEETEPVFFLFRLCHFYHKFSAPRASSIVHWFTCYRYM